MLFGLPGNLENRGRTVKPTRLSHLGPFFSGPISRLEFAADFFKTFCTFRPFWVPFGMPLGLGNGGLEQGSKKDRKQGLRVISTN